MKRILVYTYGDQSHETCINVAAAYAAENNAQLTGLFVKPDYLHYSNVYGQYPLNLAQTFYDRQKTYSDDNKRVFDAAIKKVGCAGEWHDVEQYEISPKPEFYSDCIFVSQPDVDSSVIFSETDFIDQVIMSTGIPLVVIPKSWAGPTFAKHPMLGWKESKEAAGAVRHSMSIMQHADDVDIVTFAQSKSPDDELICGIQISEYLSAHNVDCQFFEEKMHDSDQTGAETLIRHAQESDRDLIIIGGYSHSRFREIILGGVTRSLIKSTPVPLLLAH